MKIISQVNGLFKTYQKLINVLSFGLGFTWDWLTIGRIDSISEVTFLISYYVLLSVSVYLNFSFKTYRYFDKHKDLLEKYLPLSIQFFLGGLSSAFFIFFSRSVSLSKTATFLILIICVYISNEFFRKKMSLRFQFVHYSFVSYLFFACIIPVIFSALDTYIFFLSGVFSLCFTLLIEILISLRLRKKKKKRFKHLKYVIGITHIFIALCFILKLIPPVPIALNNGIVAYSIKKEGVNYNITYKPKKWFDIWNTNKNTHKFKTKDSIFVFTSIFSPNHLKKKIFHNWSHYDTNTRSWLLTDRIGYSIEGGRIKGYRGYSYKANLKNGDWKVEVVTEENLIIGILNFSIQLGEIENPDDLKTKLF